MQVWFWQRLRENWNKRSIRGEKPQISPLRFAPVEMTNSLNGVISTLQ
jgi:hypothetical protein